MKKVLLLLVFLASAGLAKAQPCQASFGFNLDSLNSTLYLYDYSYNTDSTTINITSWNWTVQYGGASYTYTTQNPVAPINGGPAQYITVCLTITTATGCTSTVCDTITPYNPPTGCQAAFTYSIALNSVMFWDASQSSVPIGQYFWTFDGGTPSTSTSQNQFVTFNSYGLHQVCLTIISSDSTCIDTWCQDIFLYDSTNANCIDYVTADVTHVSVIGGNDGAIDLTVVGGTPPYTFYWSNGAMTEDLTGLTSGIYTVEVASVDSLCPNYFLTVEVLEPYDSSLIIDTLWVAPIDTCLNFVPDSFYISNYVITGNNVTVTWVFVGQGMTQTLNITYTFANYGGYVVLLTIDCGQFKGVQTTYQSYIYLQPQAVAEMDRNGVIRLFPNPARDFINLQMELNQPGTLDIRIMNANGQIVYSSTENCGSHEFNGTVNVSQLPSGIYFVNAISKEGVLYNSKFIK